MTKPKVLDKALVPVIKIFLIIPVILVKLGKPCLGNDYGHIGYKGRGPIQS